MKQGNHILLYKKKGNPVVEAFVVGGNAELRMSLDDFKKELLKEIGSVTWTFQDKTFADKVGKAFDRIVLNIKKGSVYIA